MILVPALVSIIKLDEVKARATAITGILFMVIVSSFFYFKSDYIDWALSLKCAIGGIIGGIIFLILPTTSITTYPMFHYLSLQSFIYHGAMVYLGIIINKSQYVELEKKDIVYYSGLVGTMCLIAFIFNNIFDYYIFY